jgi:cyclopropane fatty-acyl-phospholipid synthase-like methyltransferase
MRRFSTIALATLILILTISLWWRWASRRHQLPCPYWLAWMLEGPLVDAIAGTHTTLERIGLRPGERGLDVGSGPGRLTIPAARLVQLVG